jgi:hypothetical protein
LDLIKMLSCIPIISLGLVIRISRPIDLCMHLHQNLPREGKNSDLGGPCVLSLIR